MQRKKHQVLRMVFVVVVSALSIAEATGCAVPEQEPESESSASLAASVDGGPSDGATQDADGASEADVGTPDADAGDGGAQGDAECDACCLADPDRPALDGLYAKSSQDLPGDDAPSTGGLADAIIASTARAADAGACACAKVTIHCRGAVGDSGANASCYRAPVCEIDLKLSECLMYNLHEGQIIDPTTITGSWPRPPTYGAIWDYCTVRHEAKHACDPASLSSCETEQNGYKATVQCLNEAADKFCTANPSDPRGNWNLPSWCGQLHHGIKGAIAYWLVNQCLCKQGGATCGQCIAQCSQALPAEKWFCEESGRLYCHMNGR